MTDKELRELESLAVDQDRLFDPAAVIALIAEVRRLNRMVDVSCKALSDHGIGCPLCIYSLQWDCDAECEVAKNEETCWRKYLEEAQAMAEMTVAEAIDWLTEDKAFGQECYSRKQIAQLIEQQKVAIDKAVEIIGNAFCLEDGPCPENYVKTGCKPCVLKWIGMEESP